MKTETSELKNRLVYDRHGVCRVPSFVEAQELIWSIIKALGFKVSAQTEQYIANMEEPLLPNIIITNENTQSSSLQINYLPTNRKIILILNNNIILFTIKYKEHEKTSSKIYQ